MLLYVHRGRQQMAASEHRRAIQAAVESASRALFVFGQARPDPARGSSGATASRVAVLAIPHARESFARARAAVETFFTQEGDRAEEPDRFEFESHRRILAE